MVLNLYILNNFLFFPTRVPLYNTGPLEPSLINKDVTRKIGDNIMIPKREKIMSNIFFIKLDIFKYYLFYKYRVDKVRFYGFEWY